MPLTRAAAKVSAVEAGVQGRRHEDDLEARLLGLLLLRLLLLLLLRLLLLWRLRAALERALPLLGLLAAATAAAARGTSGGAVARGQQALEQRHQKVALQRALVHLVDDDVGDAREGGVAGEADRGWRGEGGGAKGWRGEGIVVRLLLCVVVVAWVGVVWLLCGCLSLLPRRVPSFLHARRVQATPLPSPHSPFAAALPAPPPRPASPPPLTKALTAAAGCRSCRRAAACRASRRRRGARGSRRARLLFELCSNSV